MSSSQGPATGPDDTPTAPRLDLRSSRGRTFAHLLANTAVAAVINMTVWFGITFWIFLETESVLATGMIAGIFVLATATTGIWFGSVVDHHHKIRVMQVSSLLSLAFYGAALALYLLVPEGTFSDVASPLLWVFVVVVMGGVMVGNLRTIAMPTLVTLLIPPETRDRANGLVGTTTGVSFLVTSVISGVLVAAGGMLYVLLLGAVMMVAGLVHLQTITLPEREIAPQQDGTSGAAATGVVDEATGRVDLRGTMRLVGSVPGLPALIAFTCFNNFLGGAFMALMDAYGLYLVPVDVWGFLWGGLSTAVIIGGLLVARVGLGSNPLRLLLLVNLLAWTITMLFPLRSSIVILSVAMFVYMLAMPFAEAAEQTILQRVVPYERQGRVFGFAQSIEQAASPLTAFLIGPITQLAVIPWMTDGRGAQLIGGWFGTGADRGIALVFVVSGALGVVATLAALASPYYRRLSRAYQQSAPAPGEAEAAEEAATIPPQGAVTGQTAPQPGGAAVD
ncbi:MFS transporter [Desertihabitans aurantiacus]|uniref:MFS transporter n=1 Tax=Desertihabitans aurantiacus TaxID=2282477 RepID=UPI000DF7D5F4|nr:MFS transporter [Desertihabitans aurantiacus]